MEYIEKIGIAVAIFAAAFLSTQFLSLVLTLDAVVTFLGTIFLLYFTNGCLSSLSPDTAVDPLHEYLLLQTVAVMAVPALVWFLSTDPTDVTIRTALAVSRLVGFGLSTLVMLWDMYLNELFARDAFQVMLLPACTLFAVYGMHLYFNNKINVNTRYGNLNNHLHADLIMALLSGAACVLIPRSVGLVFGQELDALHVFLYRLLGVLNVGFACLPWIAPKFRSVTNRRAVLFSRALTMLGVLLVTFYKYRQGAIPEGVGSKLLMAGLVAMTLPSAVGSVRQDQGDSWDIPWRGLRVPDMAIGGGSPADLYSQARKDLRKSPRRRQQRRRSSRRRTPSRRRRR